MKSPALTIDSRLMKETSSCVVVRPGRNVAGQLSLPGDKSISHRYAMLGAIAEGTTRLENFSAGADCASTLACLRTLGVKWERDGSKVTIHGQLRFDHAHVEWHSRRAGVYQRVDRR